MQRTEQCLILYAIKIYGVFPTVINHGPRLIIRGNTYDQVTRFFNIVILQILRFNKIHFTCNVGIDGRFLS